MKQFVAILLTAICCAMTANAQSFLDRLQKQTKNQGKVTVTQDAAIDELVNGSKTIVSHPATTPIQRQPTTPPHTGNEANKTNEARKESSHTTNEAMRKKMETNTDSDASDMEIPIVDMRKKVMGKSYKVNGYRVQAFAGGNTRSDRQKAERIGNDIKMNFPDTPIYVHFYSPRWICRVGNYRSYEEAHRMLQEVRKLGYKQASIVKGKISVQY